jgi:hypothetical protein
MSGTSFSGRMITGQISMTSSGSIGAEVNTPLPAFGLGAIYSEGICMLMERSAFIA